MDRWPAGVENAPSAFHRRQALSPLVFGADYRTASPRRLAVRPISFGDGFTTLAELASASCLLRNVRFATSEWDAKIWEAFDQFGMIDFVPE